MCHYGFQEFVDQAKHYRQTGLRCSVNGDCGKEDVELTVPPRPTNVQWSLYDWIMLSLVVKAASIP